MANLRGGRSLPARRYLRGSKATPLGVQILSKPQTLQNQINQLKYQTGLNRREKQSVNLPERTYTSTTGTFEQFDRSISEDFVALNRFRDLVNGDKWRNLRLILNLRVLFGNTKQCRIVVYHSRDADTTWNAAGFLTEPDPSAFTLLFDQMINADYDGQEKLLKRVISLRGLHSIYNASQPFWEKGNIRVTYLMGPNAAEQRILDEKIQYHFQNI